ncbi:hypothetical protein HAX54_010139, partial [Datura stramonium]|nr:hypothetical protein [Datura stramonium]
QKQNNLISSQTLVPDQNQNLVADQLHLVQQGVFDQIQTVEYSQVQNLTVTDQRLVQQIQSLVKGSGIACNEKMNFDNVWSGSAGDQVQTSASVMVTDNLRSFKPQEKEPEHSDVTGTTSDMRKDNLKRRQQSEGMNREGVGIKFVLVSKIEGRTVSPIQIHRCPPGECTLNSIPVVFDDTNDDYRVIHFEDEFDQDTQSIGAQEEDDEGR